jgi:hypothetical protein
VRRPDEDVGIFCRFRCADCGAPAFRRFDEPDTRIRAFADREKIDGPSYQDLRIKARMETDRLRGSARLHLGDCNGDRGAQL